MSPAQVNSQTATHVLRCVHCGKVQETADRMFHCTQCAELVEVIYPEWVSAPQGFAMGGVAGCDIVTELSHQFA